MATATEKRNKAVELMTSRKGKNSYTQGGNRKYFFGKPDNKPGNTSQAGFSDCSSAVRAAIKAAANIDIGGNTSAQINNRKNGIVVYETDGYYPQESKLLPGDCLYFKGNESHPLDVGHVEMYIGNGKLCGHGSGTGPKISDMMSYCKSRATKKRRFFMAIRWILGDGDSDGEVIPRDLKRDCYGEDVRSLQLDLIALGYALGKYGADGDFGPNTEAAVISFQTANGLTPDGVVGQLTREKIDALRGNDGDSDDVDEPVQVKPENGVTIAPGSYNLRTGPSTSFPSAGVVRGGDVLEVVNLDGWTPVLVNGEIRFIGPKAVKK